ncbi:hypothetical protein COW36_16915 [bacterium (Candidatus Blackallbacteria) CG17_big_fil_post_rev_8_21_14_2_50_48_46]|uniref:Uncharacterized protein n=1 Tax=bacterium (Candidatus Blackallbacteria) CG17_big_fil_post_rev_8_21_14_2_50_48_46 TaxID=2014261 RepID=A0A2M7G184_9BACT|nr:MAG: hypothetical protein COW64_09225 [bacterium (Candidatus Blackallbacteria) CG18_big_fil_WC_8_21_14_2_50_49_26]PIW15485.1 MAG: hypothetical protein COW36_16915 [bacterium (Candidatus Blackallbacteria) CG17_big_fil_post_rev_8_21_14_2_50_48_46]PIW48615.1 MAG: hypothetical protein COW20_08930 [bacterium (Candidatus Blackallbacteria) CG13_big_fil_rev_8_21_14_2_50_49_14]
MEIESEVQENAEFKRAYRLILGIFGIGMSGLLIAGFAAAIYFVDKHDRKFQTVQKMQQRKHVVRHDPLVNAETLQFEIPYLHGGDPRTLRYIADLATKKSGEVKGGFQIKGLYRSQNVQIPTALTLSCDKICTLKFSVPARLALLPWYNGEKMILPEREFQLETQGYFFQVKQSKLQSLRFGAETPAPFDLSLNLRKNYHETYLDAQGKKIPF